MNKNKMIAIAAFLMVAIPLAAALVCGGDLWSMISTFSQVSIVTICLFTSFLFVASISVPADLD